MKDGQKITFHEEGDQVPGLEPGDIIIVLDQKEHPIFRRSGDDLIVRREISLADALCGCRQVIRTLDNRTLLVASQPGGDGDTSVPILPATGSRRGPGAVGLWGCPVTPSPVFGMGR